MNKLYKQYHIFILFFSFFLFTSIYSEHPHFVTLSSWHQADKENSNRSTSHSDFSYNNTWSHYKVSFPHKPHFSNYTAHDFKDYFTAREYTEHQILNQRCLYIFDEFVKFAQTYSCYKETIKQIHVELKNLNIWQKAYYSAKGTYCRGLQKRINFLYNQLDTIKTTHENYNTLPLSSKPLHCKEPIIYDHSIATFASQQSEYKILHDTYSTYTPSLSNAIEKRLSVYSNMTSDDYTLRYTDISYTLNNNTKQLLTTHGHDAAQFTQFSGNQLQHAIHQESLNLLDRIDSLSSSDLLYDHQETLINFTVAMVDYNREGFTDKATSIGDLCWTLLDYGQAIVEGAMLGVYSAVTDILNNPIQATINIVAGRQILTYQLCKVLYNVADIGVTALTNFDDAKDKWNKYVEPLNNIIDAINKKEITLRDAIKGGTALIVGWKAQSKLLGGLGKFCNTIKQKSIRFAQNNVSSFTIQQYLATPEGLLFKIASQSTKLKQSEHATALKLKHAVNNKVIKSNNVKNNTSSTTKSVISSQIKSHKRIIQNINRDLRSTINQYKDHIFSPDHKEKGILSLGKNEEVIINSLHDTIISLDQKGLIQEGPNQLRAR